MLNQTYELFNREELNNEFNKRFIDSKQTEDDYHGPFFFSELALQDFRKYYGDTIPKKIIDNYENHVNSIDGDNYKYDLNTDQFIIKK